MTAVPRVLAATVLVALLAGCSGRGPDGAQAPATLAATSSSAPPEEANATGTATHDVTLEFAGCLQLHTFFPFPVAALAQLGFTLPDGFTFASADGQTVDVLLDWWLCPKGLLNDTINGPFPGAVGSMLTGVPVVPPADLAQADPRADSPVRGDLIPLTWVVGNQVAADFLDGIPGLAGGYVAFGEVTRTTDLQAGVATGYGMQAHARFGTFDVDALVQSAPGDSPAGRYRLWLWPEGQPVTSYVDIANGIGTLVGAGAADLRFQGELDSGAPPFTAGRSQVDDQVDIVVSAVRVRDAARPATTA